MRSATILFNRLPESDKYNALRLKLIQSIFAYAVTANLSSLLAQHLNDVERWVKEWKLEGQDCVDLYVSAITLSAAVGNKKYTQKITMQYLAFLNGGEAKQLQEAHDAASTCIVNAILSENTRELDQLFRLDVVTSMKDSSDAKHQLVFELVSIFVEGDVALFIPFGTKNADALTALGFDYDTLLSEMRTLTICSLGSDNPIVSFETLQSSLQLSDSIAVEKAVITAVMTGKVDAEIDQENDQVVVKKASIRTFREAEWVKLSEKLANWKQDVAHVLHTLSLAQSSDGGNDM